MWDTIVIVAAWTGLVLMVLNVVGTVWQVAEGKNSVGQFWLRVFIAALWVITCGRVLGWW
jgi:predicted signal transduction protein with EAL and GGDEF domain